MGFILCTNFTINETKGNTGIEEVEDAFGWDSC